MARRRYKETDGQDRVRPKQVASLLSRIIQERISRGFADPRIRGLVSVTNVELADNLLIITVSISVMPDKYGVRVIAGLKSATGLFKKAIRDETVLRRVPEIRLSWMNRSRVMPLWMRLSVTGLDPSESIPRGMIRTGRIQMV